MGGERVRGRSAGGDGRERTSSIMLWRVLDFWPACGVGRERGRDVGFGAGGVVWDWVCCECTDSIWQDCGAFLFVGRSGQEDVVVAVGGVFF